MSRRQEFIGVRCIEAANVYGEGQHLYNMHLTDTEITRCRDCKHFRDVPMADGSTGHRCSGVFTFVEPTPNGFCAWAERSDA